jgi:hypothetical protein
MKRSILLIMALLLFLPGLSHGELISEDFCFYCPPGSVLQLPDAATDRYYCMIPGTPRSVAVPLWAKPVWSRITSTGCPANYFPRGDGINCYKCPLTYEFTSAITDYRRTPDWIIAPIAGFTDEAIRSKGWTPIGQINRFCSMELACENKPPYPKDLPQCDPTGTRIVIQNRYAHNGCIAQGCEGGTQRIDRDRAGNPVKSYDAIFDTYQCGK